MPRQKQPPTPTPLRCHRCGEPLDITPGRPPACLSFDCWAASRREAHPNDIDITPAEIERIFQEAKRAARRHLTLSKEDTLRQPG